MNRYWGFAPFRVLFLSAAAVLASSSVQAQTEPKNQTKGTTQVAGGYVKFGETYSLKGGANFAILKAAYTLDSFPSYGALANSATEKLLVVDVAVKNWQKDADLDFNQAGGDFMTVFDAAGNKYTGEAQLKSHGVQNTYLTLKPGQGVGQPALGDPYRVAFKLPLDAEVTKIMINQPRVGKNEEVLRYVIAGADSEADPANVIAPLPPIARDPANKAGAVALKEGKGTLNAILPAGPFTYQVTKIEPNVPSLGEKYTPEEGHRYVVVTLKVTNVDLRDQAAYDSWPHDTYVVDADGDKHAITATIKATSDEDATADSMSPGTSKTVRLLIEIGSSAPQSLVLAGSYYPWKFDLTAK